eukprot:scaffold4111_cov49-Attheya_sp.AAC.3
MTLSCYGCRRHLWTCMLLVWTVSRRCSQLSGRTSVIGVAEAAMSTIPTPRQAHAYDPPIWTRNVLENIPPHGRLHLANLPTPLYKLESYSSSKQNKNGILQSLKDEYGISLFVKRDDMTGGVELGGNKLRKLEFLMADALLANNKGCNAVVTIGGIQSNHCRATATVARMMGLEPHLILRTNPSSSDKSTSNESTSSNDDIGLTGNLLMDRMVGSHIYTCTPGEYGRIGSDALVERLCSHLRQQTTSNNNNDDDEEEEECYKPYGIPVGGSNAIGSWGYINAVEEVMGQWTAMRDSLGSFLSLDHVVFACGSGGTAAGIGLGMALARPHKPHVHAMGVCDTPSYFEQHVSEIITDMGLVLPSYLSTQEFISQHMDFHQGKGLGYATSTPEELEFCAQFAMETGIVLDPVYSGKALYQFIHHVLPNHEDPESFQNTNVLFWHTGGSLGLYDKADDLLSTLQTNSPVQRLNVYDTNHNNDKDDEGSISI